MGKLKNVFGIILFTVISLSTANAQYIGTAFPSNTFGAGTLQKKQLQLELEFRDFNFTSDQPSISLPIGLLRFGVRDNMEVYTVGVYNLGINKEITPTAYTGGFSDWRIGSKLNFLKSTDKLNMSVDVNTGILFKDSLYAANPTVTLILNQSLGNKFGLTVNLATTAVNPLSDELSMRGNYTALLGYSVSDRMSAYVELYGGLPKFEIENASFNIGTGIGYAVAKNTRLNLSGGIALKDFGNNYYVSLGIGQRILK